MFYSVDLMSKTKKRKSLVLFRESKRQMERSVSWAEAEDGRAGGVLKNFYLLPSAP